MPLCLFFNVYFNNYFCGEVKVGEDMIYFAVVLNFFFNALEKIKK